MALDAWASAAAAEAELPGRGSQVQEARVEAAREATPEFPSGRPPQERRTPAVAVAVA